MSTQNLFLFSVDLEDVRLQIPEGDRYPERVPQMVEKYLLFLRGRSAKVTFFCVGQLARNYPNLIREIQDEGHEIACHTDLHIPLDQQTKENFETDLSRNLDSLMAAGAKNIVGFRAPIFSLTQKTEWVYSVLEKHGIQYSSSVLPAKSPLYGWPGFGQNFKKMGSVWELPMSVASIMGLRVPFGGGIYFRLLPLGLIKNFMKEESKKSRPTLGYFHPYDIDTEQDRFMHPGIQDNSIYNYFMYYGRRSLLRKLEVVSQNFQMISYKNYIYSLENVVV